MTPTSTYRLQLRDGLTLDGVVDDGWLDHAADLGVSHLYLSPVLTAVPGSTHGYDVSDPQQVDAVLGGDEAFRRLAEAARDRGLGLVVDIVPNHMTADHTANRWWWDVLRHGDLSEYATMFDAQARNPEQRLQGRIFLPVLDDHYGRVLESGRIRVVRREADIVVEVDGRPFPLEPSTVAAILSPVAAGLDDDVLQLVVSSLRRADRDDPATRAAEMRVLDRELGSCLDDEAFVDLLDAELTSLNGDADRVHELLEAQHYRLAYWRAARDLGYRRFFDVNELIGVRVELDDVFERTHRAILGWIDDGLVDGLRVDHPDGLADPAKYFRDLRERLPAGWIVAEKILEHGEELPSEWPVDGTTGYEVGELIGRWIVDPGGLHALGQVRDELTGPAVGGAELISECKRLVLGEILPADLNRATDGFLQMCESLRRFRDVTRHEVHEVLREVAIAYPVYRTYVAPGESAEPRDLGLVSSVMATVAADHPELDGEVIELVGSVLTGRLDASVPFAAEVRTRIQQLTGPAMAKGKEDTAFYRDVRLVSRNEVGADPFASGADAAEVHAAFERLAATHPTTMTSLSTHDSKRSEDVRARLAVLTEQPAVWREFAVRWMGLAQGLDPDGIVDDVTRYLLCQTMVGVFPVSAERLSDYALKAVREAKVHTSWLRGEPAYEQAVADLSSALADDPGTVELVGRFVDDVVGLSGRSTAIAQKVLQLTAPGAPDLYWGSEDWFLRLVDPDNRVPPDLEVIARRAVSTTAGPADEDAKLHAVRAVLQLRKRRPECFDAGGAYEPVDVQGTDADRLLAFSRGDGVVSLLSRWSSRGPLDDETTVNLPSLDQGLMWHTVLGSDAVVGPGPVSARTLLGDWSAAVLEAR